MLARRQRAGVGSELGSAHACHMAPLPAPHHRPRWHNQAKVGARHRAYNCRLALHLARGCTSHRAFAAMLRTRLLWPCFTPGLRPSYAPGSWPCNAPGSCGRALHRTRGGFLRRARGRTAHQARVATLHTRLVWPYCSPGSCGCTAPQARVVVLHTGLRAMLRTFHKDGARGWVLLDGQVVGLPAGAGPQRHQQVTDALAVDLHHRQAYLHGGALVGSRLGRRLPGPQPGSLINTDDDS